MQKAASRQSGTDHSIDPRQPSRICHSIVNHTQIVNCEGHLMCEYIDVIIVLHIKLHIIIGISKSLSYYL